MMPPPGWTALASAGGTVGERSRQPSRSSSKAGSDDAAGPGRPRPSHGPGWRQSRFGQAGPVGEVVARRARVARAVAAGELVQRGVAIARGAASDSGTKTRSGVKHDAAPHRRAGEQVDDRLARDRDVVRRQVRRQLGAASAGTRAAISSTARVGLRLAHPQLPQPPPVRRLHPRREQRVQPREIVRLHEVQRLAHQPGDPHPRRRARRRAPPTPAPASARPAPAPPAGGAGRRRRARAATGRAPGASPHSPASNAATTRLAACRRHASSISSASCAGSTASSRTSTAG